MCRHAMSKVFGRLNDLNVMSMDLEFVWGSTGCASTFSFDFEETPEHETTPRSGKIIRSIE
jgi:hypothetical protein